MGIAIRLNIVCSQCHADLMGDRIGNEIHVIPCITCMREAINEVRDGVVAPTPIPQATINELDASIARLEEMAAGKL